MQILVINPGSTSTKVAVYDEGCCLLREVVSHTDLSVDVEKGVMSQYAQRLDAIVGVLESRGIEMGKIRAIAARGGLLRPLQGGTYLIDQTMYDDLLKGRYGDHASNLGGVIAVHLGERLGVPAYTVDPVSVDEFEDLARFSGLPELPRESIAHALNIRATARKAATVLGGELDDFNFVMVHLGSGISVAPLRRGRMIDVNNANNEGPFSLERCGTLPILSLIAMCYSGYPTSLKEMRSKVTRSGGLFAYLGTRDFREIERLIADGNGYAAITVKAMCYQVAKEIGAMASVLYGKVDRIVLTGGIAHSAFVVREITERVSYIAPVLVFPGEEEMDALASGVLRVLRGEEQALSYG